MERAGGKKTRLLQGLSGTGFEFRMHTFRCIVFLCFQLNNARGENSRKTTQRLMVRHLTPYLYPCVRTRRIGDEQFWKRKMLKITFNISFADFGRRRASIPYGMSHFGRYIRYSLLI